jgi:signal peptidase I
MDDWEAGMEERAKKASVRENVRAVVIALVAAVCLRVLVFKTYVVPTCSMYPAIGIGDRLVALKLLYGLKIPFTSARTPPFREPGNGDIVVFQSPFYEAPSLFVRVVDPALFTLTFGMMRFDPTPKYYVKRCMGLPGEKVKIVAKRVYINGER